MQTLIGINGSGRIVALCVVVLISASTAGAQPAADVESVRELADALAAERQRITELAAEIERRNTTLANLASRIEALEAKTKTVSATPAITPALPVHQPATQGTPPEQARFDFYGDALLRLATLRQQYPNCEGCPARTVGRMRLRFGVQGQLAPGVRAVIGLATGELNDPNTVYQTFGGNLSRKVVSWDRAYLTFRPPKAPWMELTAGKFPYPWVRSSMTFDIDFYPEGAGQRFSFDFKDTGAFKNVSFQALQVVVNEQANTSDAMLIGGQGIGVLRFAERVTTRVIATGIDIKRPEHVLRSQLDGSNVGVRNTNVITVDGGRAFYASNFRYANAIIENAIRTGWESLPVTVSLEYQRNLRAFASARDTAKSFRLDAGRAQRRGDWQFGWHLFDVEQESIMSALGESDWRAPSNVRQHRFGLAYMAHDRVQGIFTWYRGRTLDTNAPGALLVPGISAGNREPWANRLYFDVLYRF